MCGPPPMMDAFARGLANRGVPKFDIFREIFRSPPVLLSGDDGKRFAVTFAASGKATAEWSPAHGPLLSFGEELKLSLPSGCRVGQCESCAVKNVSGKVIQGSSPDFGANALRVTTHAQARSDRLVWTALLPQGINTPGLSRSPVRCTSRTLTPVSRQHH